MSDILKSIQSELQKKGTEKSRKSGRTFFKEQITLYGVKTPEVIQIAKKYFTQIHSKKKSEIFDFCEKLWIAGYLEESLIACNWTYKIHKMYEESDITIFENWINKYVNNWASCDTFCNHTVGTYIAMYPHKISVLKKWTHSRNRWMKRAAAVSFIVPARKGLFLEDILEIADLLFSDPDDLVQKGYGWMLKAASEARETKIFEYVMKNKSNMPRTALRYAIEKMPKHRKAQAMQR